MTISPTDRLSTPSHLGTATSTVNDRALRAEPVWDPQHRDPWRAVWQYSARRARRDQQTLYAQEARATAVIAGDKPVKYTRFVKVHAGSRSLDEASLARARSLVGLKGYVTNIAAEVMPAAEVIANYHDLWDGERSFRMSKTDLRARPMFHHTRDAIEAHLTIVIAALAVAHCIQERTGLGIANVVKQLRPLRTATIVINGVTETFPPESQGPNEKSLPASGSPNRGTKAKRPKSGQTPKYPVTCAMEVRLSREWRHRSPKISREEPHQVARTTRQRSAPFRLDWER